MTTFKGFVRSTNAAINRMERAHQQRVRQAAKIEKLRLKEEMLANAAQAVAQYNELIAMLTSIHKEVNETMEWQQFLDESVPAAPVVSNKYEQEATHKFTHYTPSFFDKLFGSVNKKKATLEQNISVAHNKDKSLFEKAQEAYTQELQEWEDLQKLAKGVLHKNGNAYKDAVARFNPMADVVDLVSSLTLTFHADHVVANLKVREDDILPKQVLTLTSTGKLSKKDMPVSKFNELYQDHVCSCLLRVSREVLALLPVDFVVVNANGDLLNSATGRIEQQTIVSAAFFPDTLARLNFEALDPSDSMKNFKHVMEYSKTAGFRVVQPLASTAFSQHSGIGEPVHLSMG